MMGDNHYAAFNLMRNEAIHYASFLEQTAKRMEPGELQGRLIDVAWILREAEVRATEKWNTPDVRLT